MPKINPSQTNASIRDLRSSAFRALVSLHSCAPGAVHELAAMLERAAAVHTAMVPGVPCEECSIKRHTAALLRSVATLRELAISELESDA